jgi:uncharacterized membrane protein YfcA
MNHTFLVLLIGLFAGWLSGLVGIGGGIVIVPALMLLLDFSLQNAQGTSIAAMVPPIGILAAYVFYKNGHVDIKTSLLIAAGFLMGALVGAYTNHLLSSKILEKIFALALILIAAKLLFK